MHLCPPQNTADFLQGTLKIKHLENIPCTALLPPKVIMNKLIPQLLQLLAGLGMGSGEPVRDLAASLASWLLH